MKRFLLLGAVALLLAGCGQQVTSGANQGALFVNVYFSGGKPVHYWVLSGGAGFQEQYGAFWHFDNVTVLYNVVSIQTTAGGLQSVIKKWGLAGVPEN